MRIYFLTEIHCQTKIRLNAYPVSILKSFSNQLYTAFRIQKFFLHRINTHCNYDSVKQFQTTSDNFLMSYRKRIK